MERKIIIVDSASNKQVTISTDAEKFGDLKAAVCAAGISIEGKDWLEGLTKTQPVSDDSVLPSNVNYKGKVTNDLVYMLTNTNKRTKSGAMSRADAYAAIKKNNWGTDVKAKFGKNYTNCTTDQLVGFVSEKQTANTSVNTPVECEHTVKNVVPVKETKTCDCITHKDYDTLVGIIAKFLYEIEQVPELTNKIQQVYAELGKDTAPAVSSLDITSVEISSLFNSIKR